MKYVKIPGDSRVSVQTVIYQNKRKLEMIQLLIEELVEYGMKHGLVNVADEVYVTNRLLELMQCNEYKNTNIKRESRTIHEILEEILNYAIQENEEFVGTFQHPSR